MIYLPGGPSHMDMYDLKPDAPVEYRGEFKPIQTNVPGVQICEHFPLQAKMWDKLACIRSRRRRSRSIPIRETSTGYSEDVNRVRPSSVVRLGRLQAPRRQQQRHAALRQPARPVERHSSPATSASLIGPSRRAAPAWRTFAWPAASPWTGSRIASACWPASIRVRRDIDASGTMSGLDSFTSRAFDMVASGTVRKALDLTQEDPRVRDRYKGVEQFLTGSPAGRGGRRLRDAVHRRLGHARRELQDAAPPAARGGSRRRQPDPGPARPRHGQGRGHGHVGRVRPRRRRSAITTPDGRDHWPPVMSALVAGGGLKMGQAIGTTSARGEYPEGSALPRPAGAGTLYRAMGIDPSMTFPNGSGRPMYILDDREPVSELL